MSVPGPTRENAPTRLPLLLAAVLAIAAVCPTGARAAALADAQAPAASYYACVVSRPVVAVGTPILMVLTPKGGPWPPGVAFTPSAAGLQGTFIPASASGTSSAPVLFVFIPLVPGGGTLGAANTVGMIEVPPPGSQLAIQPACLMARQMIGGPPA